MNSPHETSGSNSAHRRSEAGSLQRRPKIGVFDSGFGGLTVLRELMTAVPNADYLYIGDTARLPYGSKSPATVARYATSSVQFLLDRGAEYLVIACNTASALAMDAIRAAVSRPVLGVIEPGAHAALALTRTKTVSVIGTAATIQSHAYLAALQRLDVAAVEKACPLLVPLIEEGWVDHPVTKQVAKIYLDELWREEHTDGYKDPDVLVLGCTHYPLIKPLLHELLPAKTQLVDSAQATAHELAGVLGKASSSGNEPAVQFFATDSVEKFRALGSRFLGQTIERVELIALPE